MGFGDLISDQYRGVRRTRRLSRLPPHRGPVREIAEYQPRRSLGQDCV
jgi:hypothetical protein